MMTDLFEAMPLRRPRQAPNLQRVRVGGAHVFQAAQLLDDRAVDRLMAPQYLEANTFLRKQLPKG